MSTVQIPRLHNILRATGAVLRTVCPRVSWGVLAALGILAGCASAAKYVTGPLPPSSLPEPVVQVARAVAVGQPGPRLATADVQGRLAHVAAGPAPASGFHLEIDTPRGLYLATVQTFAPVILDVQQGREVTLRYSVGAAETFRLDDSQGPIFFSFAGGSPPDAGNLPMEVRPAPRSAYLEVLSSNDLCRWTVLHRKVEVSSNGIPLATLDPGTSGVVEVQGRRYRVTSAVASVPDESDCGREGEPRLAYFWSREPR